MIMKPLRVASIVSLLLAHHNHVVAGQQDDFFMYPIDGLALSEQAQECMKETSDLVENSKNNLYQVTYDFLTSITFSSLSGVNTKDTPISYRYDQDSVDAYQTACEATEGGLFVPNCWYVEPSNLNMVLKNMAMCLASTNNCQNYFLEELDVHQLGLECGIVDGDDASPEEEEEHKDPVVDDLPNYDFHGEGIDKSTPTKKKEKNSPPAAPATSQGNDNSTTQLRTVITSLVFAGIFTALGFLFVFSSKKKLRGVDEEEDDKTVSNA